MLKQKQPKAKSKPEGNRESVSDVSSVSAKPWYKSKTVWVGVATCVAGANQLLPHLAAVLSPVVMGILLFSIGLLNVALRFVTTEGIKSNSDTKGISGVVANDKG